MSMLSNVTKGKIKKPHTLLVYGPDGVGKSTFGAEAPAPIFLGSERGTDNLDVSRLPTPKTWDDVDTCVNDLYKEKHDYKSLVIDSLDWIEPLLHAAICKSHNTKSIELAAGGYGKGYIEALNYFIAFKDRLSQLRDEKGMNLILLAHSEVVNFNDPQTQIEYKRYELKLHKKASAMFREYVDAVLFVNYETFVKKDGATTKAYGDGARVMHTERRPGYDAKNRFGLPHTIPMILGDSWKDFCNAVESGQPESLEAIRARLATMLPQITDEKLKALAVDSIAKAGENARQLAAIANRLAVRLGDQ